MSDSNPSSREEKLEQAIQDALLDIEKAAEDGPEGPNGENIPMLNHNVITARNRLEDSLNGNYPW